MIKHYVLKLETIRPNQFEFSEKNLTALGPNIWNMLTPYMKSAENLSTYKIS